MAGRGLFARIGSGAPVEEVDSIVAHVRALLNTRVGESVCAPSVGVADFSDVVHAHHGGAQQLAASMRATLALHEPRLGDVEVRHVPAEGDLVLRFEISAQRLGSPGRPLRMTTVVRPGGRVDVAG
jgi:type VI secretion system protein